MFALLFVVMLPLAVLAWFGIVYGIPVWNRIFSMLWEDPLERQRAVVLKRLKELHVDGMVPEETAYLLAAKELNTTEEELKAAVVSVGAPNLMALMTGKKNMTGVILSGIDKVLKRKRR